MSYRKVAGLLVIIFACVLTIGQASNDFDGESEPISKKKEAQTLADDLLDNKFKAKKRKKVKTVRILSIDGGAMHGIIPATILKIIEEQTGQPISKLFHLVGGKSIGCMLTAGLTIPSESNHLEPKWSASDIGDKLKTQAQKIFRRRIPLVSLYDVKDLEKATFDCCENNTFDRSLTPTVGITSDCLEAKTKPICSWDQKEVFRTQDVMLASCAAPIIFHPRFLDPINPSASSHCYLVADNLFEDNNPLMILISKACKLYPKAKKFEILSLGGGIVKKQMYHKFFQPILNIPNYFLRLFDLGLNTTPLVPEEYIEDIILGHYTRIDPIISCGGGQFDSSPQNLEKLEQDTLNYLKTEENRKKFNAMLKRLSEPKD